MVYGTIMAISLLALAILTPILIEWLEPKDFYFINEHKVYRTEL